MTAILDETTPLHELLDLTGRTAVVTGGAMGIGLGIARRLHEAGAAVVVADLDAGAARDAVATLGGGDRAIAFHGDVSDERTVNAMVAAAVDGFGGLDILVNNAGIYPNVPFLDIDSATFRRTIDVNLIGLFLCTQAAARRMVAQGRGGRIINITSIDALHPSMVGLAHYDASKHGVWGFTKNIALELAPHGIWVNALAPGGVTTPGVGEMPSEIMKAFEATIPMHRMGRPDDIARAVLFLASDLSSYVTGAQLVVDGGRLLA
ncbi:MAG: SDR family oxidoreductase [Solirubrobacterales bacterium]|nr:SDR family oxidoreductase [Solirubrobacterales bacterium]